MKQLQDTLRELVAIDSSSLKSNEPIIDLLESKLRAMGFDCERHPYTDPAGVTKVNLLGTRGEGRPELALGGHSDCVPFDPAWTEALTLTEKEGKLYGRGSCDTKGFIAAVLEAIERIDRARLPQALGCVFTADEEVGCIGARRLVQEMELRPAHAIVGEPTGLAPIRAHKGYWLAEVEVRGGEGHSAFPSVGRSAILDAARLLRRVEAIGEELRDDADPDFDPAWTTLNVGTIEGGKARNVIPGRCAFPVEWRPVPHQRGEKVAELLQREIDGLRAADPGFDASFRITRREPAVSIPADEPIVRFLEEATGLPSAGVPFGTELPWFHSVGTPGCVCGPGDIRTAHRTGEYVERAELERAAVIYEQAIARFCIAD